VKSIKSVWLSLCVGLSGCTVQLPNIKICSVAGNMSAGLDCAWTNDDATEEMNLDQAVAFLEPQIEPERGGALCMSSEDFSKLKSAMEQACKKLGTSCTKETKENIVQVSERMDGLKSRVMEKRRRRKIKRSE
jgi:hypothetical protein